MVLVPLEHGVNTALCLSSVGSHLPVIAAALTPDTGSQRERERERDRDRDRDRETERQRETETDRQTGRQICFT